MLYTLLEIPLWCPICITSFSMLYLTGNTSVLPNVHNIVFDVIHLMEIPLWCPICITSFSMLYTLVEIPLWCPIFITSFSTLYNSLEIHLLYQICLTSLWHYIKNLPLFCRFCICMLHEQFSRWLQTLHKIILAHHDDNCECDCAFCLSCGDLDNLSIGTFMRLMLCPPSLRFHGSTIPLFDWQCIENEYVFLFHAGSYNNLPQLTFIFAPLTDATYATLTNSRVYLNAQ